MIERRPQCEELITQVTGRDEFQSRSRTTRCPKDAMLGQRVCKRHADLRSKWKRQSEFKAAQRIARAATVARFNRDAI